MVAYSGKGPFVLRYFDSVAEHTPVEAEDSRHQTYLPACASETKRNVESLGGSAEGAARLA
jgi:hypothetical protein